MLRRTCCDGLAVERTTEQGRNEWPLDRPVQEGRRVSPLAQGRNDARVLRWQACYDPAMSAVSFDPVADVAALIALILAVLEHRRSFKKSPKWALVNHPNSEVTTGQPPWVARYALFR